jgi:hypothetical protein
MTHLATVLIVIWLAGLLFLIGQWMNYLRLVHNNLVPEMGYSNYMRPGWWYRFGFRFSNVDPAQLTETGQTHLGGAIRMEAIMFAWMIGGAVLLMSLL